MKTGHKILSAAAVIPLLSSCASYQQTADSSALKVKPAYSVRHSSEKPDGYYQLGRYYQGQNRNEQAMEAYRKALALDEGHAEARNGMGVIYAMQGKLTEAIQQFRLAAEQGAAHIYNNLGHALYLGGFYAEATQVLEHAVALDPANQATRTNLAQAKAKPGIAVQNVAQAPQVQLAEQTTSSIRNAQPPAEPMAQGASLPVAAAAVIAQPEQPQKEQALEKAAARNAVAVVESRIQAVQVASNVYELRERAEPQRALAAAEQAMQAMKDQEMIMPVVQQEYKPTRLAEGRIHVGPVPRTVHEQRNQAASQNRASTPYSGVIKSFRIEVSNGNGLTGMGRKVVNFLGDFGYARSRLTNQKTFRVPASVVHYRTGYREEARSLMANLPGVPTLIEMNDLRQDISIRVVLGKDWLRNVAHFDRGHQGKIHLARMGPATGGQ